MFERWLALDVGAYEIRLHDYGRQADGKLRTAIAFKGADPIAYGQEAFSYIYKDAMVQIRYPIQEDDIDASISLLLKHALEVLGVTQTLLRPCFWMAVPSWADDEKLLRFQHLALDAGVKKVKFIRNEDLLQTKEACFLIHSGHSYTELGIYVNGTKRCYKKISFAGSRVDEQVKRIVATKTNCLISNEDAIALKEAASHAFWKNTNAKLSCMAMDRYQNLGQITISAADLWPALEMVEQQIVLWAKHCFKEQPFEMKQSLLKNGIRLDGGMANCFGLRQLLEQAFSCPVLVKEMPQYEIINTMKELQP